MGRTGHPARLPVTFGRLVNFSVNRTTVTLDAFLSLEEVTDCLETVLAASPADETEIVWLQRQRSFVASDGRSHDGQPRVSVLVRVVEGGRLGWYRAETTDANELESGVRQALALAKVQSKLGRRRVFLRKRVDDSAQLARTPTLRDPALESLTSEGAALQLLEPLGSDVDAIARWSVSRLAIFNSHGLRRAAGTTDVTLRVTTGPSHGGGHAAAAARTLVQLAPEQLAARARAAATPEGVSTGTVPTDPVPVLLAPEAIATLLDAINSHAFSGRAFLDGTSFLNQHRNVQVFDRQINLRDDGMAEDGIAFPFDLEGAIKQPLDLIVNGTPSTPALNRHQSLEAGLKPTGQAVGGEDSWFGNLFLQPGDHDATALREAADGGLWIGWLDVPTCLDPLHLELRGIARGVRRITGGSLGPPLPDLVWQGSLLRALARVRAIGQEPAVRILPTTPFGGVSAPALVLDELGSFGPA